MTDIQKILAMRKSFETVKKRQKENITKIPDLQERLKRLRAVREECVGNSDIIKKSIENLENNGFKVKFAEDSRKAIDIVLKEIGSTKIVVKSKSNITREVNLTKELEKREINVVETDIGDRLIQLLGEEPSHPTGPASHLSLDYIVSSLNEKFEIELERDPLAIIEFLLKDIKRYIGIAEVGITGANAITAEGSVILLHNEGNVFETILRPKKWIVLVGIDKFYPSVEDALNAAKIQTFYATGAIIPSFIEVVSGVSKTADIEKKLYEGIHNPKEVTVILVDNKRSYLMKNGFKELFYCIGCGNCVINCPSYKAFGSKFKGGRFALFSALYGGESDLRLCLSCGRCKKNCPLGLDIPKMIRKAREGNELYNFVMSHVKWLVRSAYLETIAFYEMLKSWYV
ncbi:lactate utilization protein [Archaeoglobales archaeon]|nr:MAG: lactate utilization protein [Archaeoglobales archaeon]